jgi:hypothetical protein
VATLRKGKFADKPAVQAHMHDIGRAMGSTLQSALEATMEEVGEQQHAIRVKSNLHKSNPYQTGHLTTTNKAKYDNFCKKAKLINAAMKQLAKNPNPDTEGTSYPHAYKQLCIEQPDLRYACEPAGGGLCGDWQNILFRAKAEAKKSAKNILNAHEKKKAYELSLRLDHELRYSTKQVHNRIFSRGENQHALDAVRKPDGSISVDPEEVLAETTRYFAGTSTSVVRPDLAKEFPWMNVDDPSTQDHFTLPKVSDSIPHGFRVGSLYNRLIYDHCWQHLPDRKTPGLDGVPNEVIKHLPVSFHDTTHSLFTEMWLLALTPTNWKSSLTVLLYKKDDPHNVKNYRPIGLLNTIYKLWTAVVAKCLSMFVEQYELLSPRQEDFRANRNTTRQLQRLAMTIEDAKLTNSPLYILYVDFENAFGSVDHLRMAEIMRVQGYPEDVVDIIVD